MTEPSTENPTESSIELSIVMPCRNEAVTIGICIDKALAYMQSAGINGEVVIADNASTDDSAKIATTRGARVVAVAELGYGNALQAGINAAEGRFIIMGDADDSYDFSDLDKFVEKLRNGNDLVMGNRFKGGIEAGAMPPLHRYLGNPVLSFVGRLFFQSKVGDFHCGLRGFNREKILELDLSAPGMEFASELVVKASLAEFQIIEVPTTLSKDGRDRAPHLNTWRDGWRHLRFLLLFSPRWMFLYPGVVATIIGTILSSFLVVQPIDLGGAVLDIQTLLYTSGMTIIGIQMIFFAVITQTLGTFFGQFLRSERLESALRFFSVETGLLLGLLVALAGMVWTVFAFSQWQEVDFSALDPRIAMRQTIPAVTLVIVGVQTVLNAFVLGAIESLSPRRTEQ